jgi:hypothetical protein
MLSKEKLGVVCAYADSQSPQALHIRASTKTCLAELLLWKALSNPIPLSMNWQNLAV